MKIYEGNPGVQKYFLEDYQYQQEGINSAIFNLSKIYGESWIIWGCEITKTGGDNDPALCSEGWIVFKGEPMYVPAHQCANRWIDLFTLVSYDPQFVPVVTVDAQQTNANGITYDTRINREARVTEPLLAGANKAPYIHMIKNTGNVPIDLSNGWVAGANPVANPFYRVENGRVYLYGDITFPGDVPPTNAPFFQIDAGLRPGPHDKQIFTVQTGDGFNGTDYLINPSNTWIRVDENGRCWADIVKGKTTSINLAGVSWPAKQ